MISKQMTVRYAGALAFAAALAVATPAAEASYQTLYSGTVAMTATATWTDATFTYKVEYDLGNLGDVVKWKYTYSLSDSTSPRDISHIIVELTNPFTGTISVVNPDDFETPEIKTHTEQQGNPNLPSNLYGIKVDFKDDGSVPTSISFESNHAPMWGDLYFKDGKVGEVDVTAYNIGFGSNPSPLEPTAAQWSAILAAANPTSAFLALWGGSAPGCTAGANCWALVPDSQVTTVIPVPAALPILAAALAGFGFAGWRQRRKDT